MTLTLALIEARAPDPASLKAAGKLAKPGQWPDRGRSADGGLAWGSCKGSGAQPYLVAVDTADQGSKCTCPSRKFPCKHALALMLWLVEDPDGFEQAEPPPWVHDWLAKRRDGTRAKAAAEPAGGAEDPKAAEKRREAAGKRARATERSAAEATRELDVWVADQLRTGLNGLLGELPKRCRRIATRLVDGKATALAGRLDALPSRVLALPPQQRAEQLLFELGQLALLIRAWRAAPDDPALRREVLRAETRDEVAGSADALRVRSAWEAVGVRSLNRLDGVVARTTWLLNLGEDGPRFALLQDFHRASAAPPGDSPAVGERFPGELAFHPSASPLRAVIAERGTGEVAGEGSAPPGWPVSPGDDPFAARAAWLGRAPWLAEVPALLPPGRVCLADDGAPWWRSADGRHALPVQHGLHAVATAFDLAAAAGVWRGDGVELTAAATELGRLAFDG